MPINMENLPKIYQDGIIRTGFKSNVLNKINNLRALLEMPPRLEALKANEYDSEVTQALSKIDFSSISPFNNVVAFGVLKIAGSGLLPAPLLNDVENFSVVVDENVGSPENTKLATEDAEELSNSYVNTTSTAGQNTGNNISLAGNTEDEFYSEMYSK